MKTVKQLLSLILLLSSVNAFSQYSETFSTANKGILQGSCGATWTSCASFDVSGIDWEINGDLSGIDSGDLYATNSSGVMRAHGDIDGEACVETPVLDVSGVAGAASLSVDLEWVSHDVSDYIDVEYQLDGGAWIQIPNQFGGGSHTIDYNTDVNNGSATISQPGLVGSTLSVRVCVNTNSSADNTFIDNFSVPEAGAIILPVKWAEFNARSTSKGNQLNWATYTEVNNERFDIEKSADGSFDFIKIGSVDGAGTATSTSRYEFLDRDQSSATSYYRIKQVDLDGHFEYSEIVMVKNSLKDKIRFTPNPFSTQILMSMNQQDLVEGTSLRMYNNQGQLVLQKEITKLNLNDPIDAGHLNAGMYSIQYSNGEVVRLLKF